MTTIRAFIKRQSLTAANIIYGPEALGGISNFILDFVTAAAWWALVVVLFTVSRKPRLRQKALDQDHRRIVTA